MVRWTEEVRGEPVQVAGRTYVPVSRRTVIRAAPRVFGVFVSYHRPARIEIYDGEDAAGSVRIPDRELQVRMALGVLVVCAWAFRRRRRHR